MSLGKVLSDITMEELRAMFPIFLTQQSLRHRQKKYTLEIIPARQDSRP